MKIQLMVTPTFEVSPKIKMSTKQVTLDVTLLIISSMLFMDDFDQKYFFLEWIVKISHD